MVSPAGLLVILDGIQFIQEFLHGVIPVEVMDFHLAFDVRHQLQCKELYKQLAFEISSDDTDILRISKRSLRFPKDFSIRSRMR